MFFFEMGYAIGVKKPVIILAKEGTQVPADFRGRLFFQYRESDLDLIPQTLQGYIRSVVDSLLAEHFQTNYNARAFSNRSISDLTLNLMKAQKKIDILTNNLNSIVNMGYPNLIKERLKKCPNLMVRILTLDPESDFATQRARQLGISTRKFRDQLRESLEKMSSIIAGRGEQCRIATYDEFPTQVTFRIDDSVYINVVSANQQSRNNIIFKLKEYNAGVPGSILSHFDTVWGRSERLRTTNAEQALARKGIDAEVMLDVPLAEEDFKTSLVISCVRNL